MTRLINVSIDDEFDLSHETSNIRFDVFGKIRYTDDEAMVDRVIGNWVEVTK